MTGLLVVSLSYAKPPFLRTFLEVYKIKEGSKIASARCKICHVQAGPPDKNPYGEAVLKALRDSNERMVSPDILKKVEMMKGADKVEYVKKIYANVLPTDPLPSTKHPIKHKKTSKKHK